MFTSLARIVEPSYEVSYSNLFFFFALVSHIHRKGVPLDLSWGISHDLRNAKYNVHDKLLLV